MAAVAKKQHAMDAVMSTLTIDFMVFSPLLSVFAIAIDVILFMDLDECPHRLTPDQR